MNHLYAYAFLLTEAGLAAVSSCAYGTSIPRVRLDLLSELRIPEAGKALKKRVADLIRASIIGLEEHVRNLELARRPIEQLDEIQAVRPMCDSRRVRCSSWSGPFPTLGAWNFASAGGALLHLSKNWRRRMGDLIRSDGIYHGPRFARIRCSPPHGINFLSQRDVFLSRLIPRRISHPGFVDRLLFVQEGNLILGGHGTLGEGEVFGRTVYVDRELSRYGFTQDLLRVIPNKGDEALCYAFLSSTVGFRLLRGAAVGTKLCSLRPDLVRALPAPEVDAQTLKAIRSHIESASKARSDSLMAEAEAIRLMEEEVIAPWRR